MIPATSGTAKIYDEDITDNMDKIRRNLGWCPQHVNEYFSISHLCFSSFQQNVLFEKLTVEEHLLFFWKLKQVQSKEMKKKIDKYGNQSPRIS